MEPKDITVEWLSEILETLVLSFDISPVDVAGFGSISVRLTVTLSDMSVRSLFAKFILPAAIRGPMSAPFQHEVKFYNSVASLTKSLGKMIPDCVFAGDSAIILKDEVVSSSGIVGDQFAGCSIERSVMVVELLARMHSQFWKSELLATDELQLMSIISLSQLGDSSHLSMISEVLIKGMRAHRSILMPSLIDGTTSIVPNSIPVDAFDALAIAAGRGIDLLFAASQRFNTMCHQDVRLDNMIFCPKCGGEDVILLDWQRYSAGWNMLDVAQYIVFNIHAKNYDSSALHDIEIHLFRVYIETLAKSRVVADTECYTMDRAMADYKLAIALLCVMDLPTWLEQEQKYSDISTSNNINHTYIELFSSERMASLAPLISSNLAAAYFRNGCSDLLDSLPICWDTSHNK